MSQHGYEPRQNQDEMGGDGRDRQAMTRPDDRRGMTRGDAGSDQGSQGWTGYVLPYRYYGPGYRGVGYYSVFYQGSDDPGEGEGQTTESGQRSTGRASGGRSWSGTSAPSGRSGGSGRGGQAGRGPKGYRRSDERIREELNDRLMADDELDASDVEVSVKDGEVTLSGTVEDRSAKRLAEDIADAVMGVREVMNQIRVGSPSQATSEDRNRSESTMSQADRGRTRRTGTESDEAQSNGSRERVSSSR